MKLDDEDVKEEEEGSSYYSEGEESEWEEEETEQEEVVIENEGEKPQDSRSRDQVDGDAKKKKEVVGKKAAADQVKMVPQQPEVPKKEYNPITDNIMDIPNESVLINESMQNFEPPIEEQANGTLLSIKSHLPETARKGIRGGIPLDQIMLSDDSIE